MARIIQPYRTHVTHEVGDLTPVFEPNRDNPKSMLAGVPVYRNDTEFNRSYAGQVVYLQNVGLVELRRWTHPGSNLAVSFSPLTHGRFIGVLSSRFTGTPRSNQFAFANNTFEIYRVNGQNGWSGRTAWYPYDPFSSGPWRNYEYKGVAYSQDQADHLVTAVNDVVVLGSQVLRCTSYTAAQAAYETVRPFALTPRYRNNPTVEIYGRGQTERWPSTYGETFTTASPAAATTRRLRFNRGAAGKNFLFDATPADFFIDADVNRDAAPFVGVGNISSNIDGGKTPVTGTNPVQVREPSTITNDTVFRLKDGVYNIKLQYEIGVSTNTLIGLILFKITAANDEVIDGYTAGYGLNAAPLPISGQLPIAIGTIKEFVAENLIVSNTDSFYFVVTNAPVDSDSKHYMSIERLA